MIKRLRLVAYCFIAAVLLSSAGDTAHADQRPNDQRPNIVLIMADDMGYECVSANGGGPYRTPHLDKLAAGGIRFTQCYSQPICTPSRVQIMTGRYNSRNYIRFGVLDKKEKTFGNMMRSAGYQTCVVGKWQLKGGLKAPDHFGFDEYCLWQLTRRPNRYPNPGLEINGKEVDYNDGQYGPDIVSDYACQFMERNQDKPFFLYYPMILPHWPFEPTPDSEEWDPTARRGDKAEKSRGQRKRKFFIDMVHYTDKIVGKLDAKLEELGIRDNTLFIFTGDNGTYTGITSTLNGQPYQGGKGRTTDNGVHVPMIVSWPAKIKSGRVNGDLIDFSDMLPTMADATGAELPQGVKIDGRSFLPQLLEKPGEPREWVYCWYYRNGRVGEKRGGQFARTKQYKYYLRGDFYDVVADPQEKSPLAPERLSAEQRGIRDQLKAVVKRYER